MLQSSFRHWRHSCAAEDLFSFLLQGFIRCRLTCSTAAALGSASLWPQGRKTWGPRRASAAWGWVLSLWPGRSAQLSHLSHRDIKVPSSGVAVRIKSICITVLNTLHTTGIHYSQRRHCCGSQTDKGLPESPLSILSCPWPPDPLLSCL